MPFQPVPTTDSGQGSGNFPSDMRKFFNQCGQGDYCGSVRFDDVKHNQRTVPIFYDECLEGKPETYKLLKQLRRGLKMPLDRILFVEVDSARSIHQNEHGYLPYKDDGGADRSHVSASAIRDTARAFGSLPHNQSSTKVKTRGQFMEYTCGDKMHAGARLIVDYRFGFIYMTFGHYHADSFALLVRSDAELQFELKPTLPELNATFVP